MSKFEFNVLLEIGGVSRWKEFRVYAADVGMARGILRGQSAVMGWRVLDILEV